MPQLIKGGKYIFGWSMIRTNREVRIPDEAYLEYGFINDEKGILTQGSKLSGGFALSSKRLLKNVIIGNLLTACPELINYQLTEGEIIKIKCRNFCWIKIYENRFIILPDSLLKVFEININTNLLVVRGSGIALGFIAKGPIYEEAKKHSEIPFY